MLTPKLVTFLYWLLLIGCFISGFIFMFSGYGGLTAEKLFTGLLTIIGGSITARLWCELMIVIFKINDNLQAIKDQKKDVTL